MDQRVDINRVLADIRSVRSQMQQAQRIQPIQPEMRPERPGTIQGATAAPSFSEMLKQAVNTVDGIQQQASDLRNAYVRGEPDVDLARVMIASQKSSVAFQALTQVRNRVVQAYEDVMKMPI